MVNSPLKVCVYDCDGNETEYTEASDIGRFFAGEICFNSFALAPADNSFYLVKVRVSDCAGSERVHDGFKRATDCPASRKRTQRRGRRPRLIRHV